MVAVVLLIITAIIFCIGTAFIIWNDDEYTIKFRIGVILVAWGLVMCILTLIGSCEYKLHQVKESHIYTITYNDECYYTNDYVLSNGGIDFITEKGHFNFPVEGSSLKIERNK